MIRTTDLLIYPSRATVADAVGGMPDGAMTEKVRQFAFALAEDCQSTGIDFAYAFSHAANECDYFRDSDWTRDTNAFGIGNTDGSGGVVFPSPDACADFFTWELLTKIGKDASAFAYVREYAPIKFDRVTAIVQRPDFPTVERIDDLNQQFGDNDCVWMCDERGPEAIVSKSRALFPGIADQGASPVTYTTNVPGLPGGPLVTTYPIRMNLIAVDGYQRTGQKAHTPRRSVQHGTGNPSNESAMAEAQYFVNGAEGRQASVHACSDDREVVVCMPLDEIAWHAADGAGPGNMNGYACEMMEAVAMWANTGRRDMLISITADFMGRVSARFGVAKPERHWDFNAGSADRHHCPDKLMSTGLWDSQYVPLFQAARLDELKRMKGETKPDPTYATPSIPKWFDAVAKADYPTNQTFDNGVRFLVCKKQLSVKKACTQRVSAGAKAKFCGPDLAAGVAVDILGHFKSGSTKYVLAAGSSKDKIAKGARIRMADLDELISITER